jgi:hypothetical protein
MQAEPNVFLPRIIAAVIGALLTYAGIEIGEEAGVTHEMLESLSFGIAMVGYAVAHKLISKRLNPADLAQERRGNRDQDKPPAPLSTTYTPRE